MERYRRIRLVGKGSYGEVYLVQCLEERSKKQFVIKHLSLASASARERKAAEQEANLLSSLRHPNIVTYRESWEEGGCLHIVMGFCEGGDLYHRLRQQNGQLLPEPQIVQWFVQIAMALKYLHDNSILHRDLKTQNIFLTRGDVIKVGDLGIARVLDEPAAMANTLIGTPYYMSPELFQNQPYNYKSDVWALGCCAVEMATLRHAFNARDMNALVLKVVKGKIPTLPPQYSRELGELIVSMLSRSPDERPGLQHILKRQFIRKHISDFLQKMEAEHKRGGRSAARKPRERAEKAPSQSQPSVKVSMETGDSCVPIATISNVELQLGSLGNGPWGDKEDKGGPPLDKQKGRRRGSSPSSDSAIHPISDPNSKMNPNRKPKPNPNPETSSNPVAKRNPTPTPKVANPLLPTATATPNPTRDPDPDLDPKPRPTPNTGQRPHSTRTEASGCCTSDPVTPPVATPPAATPPVATPPVATPPVATPPVATPPAVPSQGVPAPSHRSVARERRRQRKLQEEQQHVPLVVQHRPLVSLGPAPAAPPAPAAHPTTQPRVPAAVVSESQRESGLGSLVSDEDDDDEASASRGSVAGSKDSCGRQSSAGSCDVQDLMEAMTLTLKMEPRGAPPITNGHTPLAASQNAMRGFHRKFQDTLVLKGKAPDPSTFLLTLSPESGARSGRVQQQLLCLRKELLPALHWETLEAAYAILDSEHQQQEKLIELLGEARFREFGEKIWRLKFFEEMMDIGP
ncbi:serine/threonine-protein kinase Nek4-like [Lethenteron reissneri]|uniref:serine/threonine-protein kinase Nek4-like n=1 Tax=Lethenteron reissneri TaxID=7753 RepID=UPI002AB79848|nr:serine/threonine-protein kinase Nek4-like [Lethenteron reissneri]